MMLSGSFRSVLLSVLGFTVIVIGISFEMIASPRQIKDAVSDSVTGFDCPALRVEVEGGSLYGHTHRMRAALQMPPSCIADLGNRIRGSSMFTAESCNIVETCWIRRSQQTTYTFAFHEDYVGFDVERR